MTTEPSIDGLSFPLDCFGTPVRVIMRDGCPWFEALPLCAAMGVDWQAFVRFAVTALDTDVRHVPFDTEPLPAFSPIGHYEFVKSFCVPELAKYAAWTRKRAAEMVSNPDPDDMRLCLTLNPDGTRPDEPNRYTGRHYEWKELKYRTGWRSSSPVLFDRRRPSVHGGDIDAFMASVAQRAAVRNAATYTTNQPTN